MKFTLFTIFPDYFAGPLQTSLLGKAVEAGLVDVSTVDLRGYATDKHRSVDDTPYGGGPGMVMKPEPLVAALEAHPVTAGGTRVYLTPWGYPLTQARAERWANLPEVQFLCGRYEGVDERVIDGWIDEAVSVGDFVMSGGEPAALCAIDAVARLVPGVIGEAESLAEESFANGLLEGPHYTRPASFRGRDVPEVLRSGDHQAIERWRREQSLARTRTYRPDLLTDEDSSLGS